MPKPDYAWILPTNGFSLTTIISAVGIDRT